jgi:hypothetical protein
MTGEPEAGGNEKGRVSAMGAGGEGLPSLELIQDPHDTPHKSPEAVAVMGMTLWSPLTHSSVPFSPTQGPGVISVTRQTQANLKVWRLSCLAGGWETGNSPA